MGEKYNLKLSASRALAIACAAALSSATAHADSTIYEYQFTSYSFNPTTVATNLVGAPFSYTNADPSQPPFSNPAFIVSGSLPDPPYYVGQGDWFPHALMSDDNYYTLQVSVAPGFTLNASSISYNANSRQAVLFDSQVAYSNSPSFSSPVNFDTTAFQIPAANVWNTFTASDAPISNGTGTYYFRIYGQIDPGGSGSISDLLNLSNVLLTGSVQTDTAATNMYWDPASVGSPGSGGAGTWTGGTPWADGAVDYVWSNTIAEIANFGGATTGTVALGGNVSALNGINFTTGGYNITGTSGQVLTVAGTINASADATISASLTTSGAFTKAGSGALTIAGSASFGTALSVTGGTLKVVADIIDSSTASISSGAVLEYNDSAYTYQTPITYTGAGTLRETGSGNLIFGAYGAINVDLSPGGLIDVEGGLLTGSSSYGGNWTANQGSLNIAGGASFNAVEAGLTAAMQIDALTGAGNFLGGYFGNSGGGLSTVTIGVAGGSGTFSGSLQDNPGARLGITKTGSGTETFTGSNSYSGGTIVNGGTLVIGTAAAQPNSTVSIGSTGKLQLASGIGGITLQSLSIIGSGVLDLTNNHMFIDYAPGTRATADATIRGYLISGRAGGTWTGVGINSSTAALPANVKYGIGYADGADGIAKGLSSGQIEIKYTLLGDADLDGAVTGSDFTDLVGNLGKSGRTWDQGDFDYDGSVTGSDFTALVGNLGKSASGAAVMIPAADYAAIDAFAAANGLMADVPEPATIGLFTLGILGVLGRRRRS
jgi:autotransporter-associated beta strand protein